MKTKKITIVLVLILTFSCQKRKKVTEIKTDSKIELKNEISKIESEPETNQHPNKVSEKMTFRNITELDKYKGFTKIVGMVLDGTEKALAYIQKDSIQVLVLEQIIRNNSSKVQYQILDEVQIIADKSKLFSEPSDCKIIDDSEEKFIFGIVNDQDKEFFDKDYILKVWKVNLMDNKFEEIGKERVRCFNHWFGYDG